MICERPIEVQVLVCKNVIRRLRSKNKVYNNLYVNYLAFTARKPCKTVRVWINQEKLFVQQPVLNCFGRSAIMSFEWSDEIVHLYREIVIYTLNTSNLLIFTLNKDRNYYTLLEGHTYNLNNDVTFFPK